MISCNQHIDHLSICYSSSAGAARAQDTSTKEQQEATEPLLLWQAESAGGLLLWQAESAGGLLLWQAESAGREKPAGAARAQVISTKEQQEAAEPLLLWLAESAGGWQPLPRRGQEQGL